jgi:hypothetical protein
MPPLAFVASTFHVLFKRVDLMRAFRVFLANWYLLGAGLALPVAAAGCGDSGKTEVVVPAVPPTESGKDSMDFGRPQSKGGANKK